MTEKIIVWERQPDPGQQWKCGDEFLPFHPQASHIEPAYRDGWNRCYWMAVTKGLTKPPAPPECKTEAEKTAYAFGWWKAMESQHQGGQP